VIPLFPELRPYLEAAFDLAEPGTEFVIHRYRDANVNPRTRMERIIQKAGLKPWPKLFQNLRSTRETELAESFPIHVVCARIGNSEAIARSTICKSPTNTSKRLAKLCKIRCSNLPKRLAGPRSKSSRPSFLPSIAMSCMLVL
jgi:hypothetical protein